MHYRDERDALRGRVDGLEEALASERPAPAPTAETPAPTVTAIWKARVKHATGLPLSPGSTCTIEAKLAGVRADIDVPELAIVCGTTAVYRSTDPLNGMSSFHSGVKESSGAVAGTHEYVLSYEDKGTRSASRAEVSLESSARAGAVWRDSVPSYRIELDVPVKSAAVRGEPLLADR